MYLCGEDKLKIAAIDFDHTVPIVARGSEVDIRIVEETGDGHYLVDTPTIIDPLALVVTQTAIAAQITLVNFVRFGE